MLHSATKFLGGHSDSLAGVICTNREDINEKLTETRLRMGNHLEEYTCSTLYQGLETLKLRVMRQQASGLRVAAYLQQHPKVEKVLYPLLTTHPGYEIHKSQSTGFTGMLSFYLRSESYDNLCEFAKDLRLFKFGTSLGGVDSLIDHYGGTMRIFYTDKKQQEERGYTDNFFRMSVGIEEPEDLIEDLRQALEKL